MTSDDPVRTNEQRDDPEAEARKAIAKAALGRIGRASLKDLLSFLKVADVARGSGLTRFYKLFPAGGEGRRAGRDALVQAVETEAITGKVWLEVEDAMRLPLLMRDRDKKAFEVLRKLATGDVRAYSEDSELRGPEVLRSLMTIAAHAGDKRARELLKERYERIEPAYGSFYRSLLQDALGREPIPGVDTMERLGLVIAALFDGLVLQHSFDEETVEKLAEATIVPLLGALTYPEDAQPPTDSDHLYPPGPATASYRLTPPHLRPLPQNALDGLLGTWQGTTQTVARATGKHQPNTYLVLSDHEERLEVVQFTHGGISRAVLPAFLTVGGRRRLTCVYEAERTDAQYPSHRGGLILEAPDDRNAQSLEGAYFTDTGHRGELTFNDHRPTVATSYIHAQSLFDEPSTDTDPSAP
jgi:hypothetical protein